MHVSPALLRIATLGTALTLAGGGLAAVPAQASPQPAGAPALDLLTAATRAVAAQGQAPVKVSARTLDLPAPTKAAPGAVPSVGAGQPVRILRTTLSRTATIGITWPQRPNDTAVKIQMRTNEAQGWTAWRPVEVEATPDGAPNPKGLSGTNAITVSNATAVEVAVTTTDGKPIVGAKLTVIDPGATGSDAAPRLDTTQKLSAPDGPLADVPALDTTRAQDGPMTVTPAVDTSTPSAATSATATSTTEPQPAGMPWVNSRAAWGADESLATWPAWRMNKTKAIVVHHTAGDNNYTADQVPGLLRGIYYFHAVSRGWGDIGYNVLVDKFGRAWQGRVGGPFTPNLGGHAAPNNDETMGISMLGNFETAVPTSAAIGAVARVAAYKLSASGIRADQYVSIKDHDGIAHTYPAVVTHQAVASYSIYATACPGKNMISQMGSLRSQVLSLQNTAQGGQLYGVHKLTGTSNRLRSFELSTTTFMPWEDTAWSDPSDVIDGVDALIITWGSDYYPVEPIVGANLALSWNSPVLSVTGSSMTTSQLAEITRLKPRRVFVVGNKYQINDTMVSEIGTAANRSGWWTPVRRITASGTPDTVAAISAQMYRPSRIVYLAESTRPEWMAGLPQKAKATRSPILVTTNGQLTAATKARLAAIAPTEIRMAGSSTVFSDATVASVRSAFPSSSVYRYHYLGTADTQNSLFAAGAISGNTNPHNYYVRWDNLGMAGPALAAAGATGGAVYFTFPTCIAAAQNGWANKYTPAVRHALSPYSYSGGVPFTRSCFG